MRLKTKYNSKRKNILCTGLLMCAIILAGPCVQAASKHTTKPKVTIHPGDGNPFKHDTAKCTILYCTHHPKSSGGASRVTVTLEEKSSAKNTKVQSEDYTALGIGRGDMAFCDWNKGSKTITAKTAEADKYNVRARYKTGDCACLSCIAEDEIDYDKFCYKTSKWKKEEKVKKK